MALRGFEQVTKGTYMKGVARVRAEHRKWFDLMQGVASSKTGVRLEFDTDDEAARVREKMRAMIRRFPAQLWGVVVERVGATLVVVPLEYLEHKQRRVTEAIRERVQRQRGA